MKPATSTAAATDSAGYLYGRAAAWFALVMTLALMLLDYAARQVIVSLFPHIKQSWGLSDTELGSLVSVVSVTVALAGLPVALLADRFGRVRSICAMAAVWSLATLASMFAGNYAQLFAARAVVGLGEAGYGAVGAALLFSHFPRRLRGTVLAALFAFASVGSVLGVLAGGFIAERWGWQAAFGVLGVPGLVLALLYLRVRDYAPTPGTAPSTHRGLIASLREGLRAFMRSRIAPLVCLGAGLQLIVVSAIWSWLPSFLNRTYGIAAGRAAALAAGVVLAGALGSLFWGRIVDRAASPGNRVRLRLLAWLCIASAAIVAAAFGYAGLAAEATLRTQMALVAAAGFMMTCTVGPVSAIVIGEADESLRSTGASLLSLFQNLLGLAMGPLLVGALSDRIGLQPALMLVACSGALAAIIFWIAAQRATADGVAPG